jgi:hypothetical protein
MELALTPSDRDGYFDHIAKQQGSFYGSAEQAHDYWRTGPTTWASSYALDGCPQSCSSNELAHRFKLTLC